MARPLRIQYPGAVYHLTARGNRQEFIYLSDSDREAFLDILGKTVRRYGWICHAYCLMDNHYHLLIETPKANLSLGMRQLNGIFTQYANRAHGNAGHVFQGRYTSILVEKNSHLLELCRYIVLNPVRAHLCGHPGMWPWSSYQATATGKHSADFLTVSWILKQFAKQQATARKRYVEFVTDGCLHPPAPWDNLKAQIMYGSDAFIESLQGYLQGAKLATEFPKAQRYAARPQLEELFGKVAQEEKKHRNDIIVKAHLEFGYTLKQIADYVGLHYTTISKIVSVDK